ncbi:uncharacterized protein LOC124290953 [Haliotis rubra]|uniref:uncharacterized protein LOC124290953 n=1 Tax=Haliotis rubra TaxID=36100 RepID=UPI001EE619F3|nr:uncharacterized protein LOC124290953 [Haliotis rubra]
MGSDIDMIEVHTISSTHLTTAQCDLLKYIVGRRREIRAAGVVEVLTADVTDAGSRTWAHKGYGVICFIKDHPGKRYIFKAYNLMTRQEIHEHTINNKFKYIEKSDRFHYMTGAKNRMTGLNFIDEIEAKLFKETVDCKREQWTFPSIPPHPRGLPDYIPPHVSLQEIIQELPQDVPTQAPTQTPTQTPTQVPTLVPDDIPSRTPQEIFSQTQQDLLTQVPQDILTQTPQDLFTRVPEEVPSQIQSQGTEQDVTSHVSQEMTSAVSQEMTSQAAQKVPITRPLTADGTGRCR